MEFNVTLFFICRSRNKTADNEAYFFQQISVMNIVVTCDETGLRALISCPFCEAQITVRQEKSRSWKVSNFSSHLRIKHTDINIPGDDITHEPKRAKKTACTRSPENSFEVIPTPLEETVSCVTEYLYEAQSDQEEEQKFMQSIGEDEPSSYLLEHIEMQLQNADQSQMIENKEKGQQIFHGSADSLN